MAMRLRLYLDTSVFSVNFDERSPERKQMTEAFFARSKEFVLSSSEVARREMGDAPLPQQRESMLALLETMTVHPLTDEMVELASAYRREGIFTEGMIEDSLHVAAAVLTEQHILVSWNFKHLVNRRRRSMVNLVNESRRLPMIEILSPPEL